MVVPVTLKRKCLTRRYRMVLKGRILLKIPLACSGPYDRVSRLKSPESSCFILHQDSKY